MDEKILDTGFPQGAGENLYGITSSTEKACIFTLDPMAMSTGNPRIPASLGTQPGTPDSTHPEQYQGFAFLDLGEF